MAEYKMVLLCSKCRNELSAESNCISCGLCKKKFHIRCVDLNYDVQQMLTKSSKWHCANCGPSSNLQSAEDAVERSSVTTTEGNHSSSNSFSNLLPFANLPSNISFANGMFEQVSATCQNLKGGVDTLLNIKHAKNVNHSEYMPFSNVSQFSYNVYSKGEWYGAGGGPTTRSSSRDDALNYNSLTSCLKKKCAAENKTVSRIICDGKEKQEYAIEDYFVNIQIEECNLQGLRSNKATIPLDKIFYTEDKQGKRTKRTILITADAGLGKTTLMKKLCYDWGTLEEEHYLCNFDFVINIPLKNVGHQSIKSYTLNKICSAIGCRELNDSVLAEWNVLYILDGYDETTETEKAISFLEEHLERSQSNLSKGVSTVILTSRPYAVEKFEDPQRMFDRRLSISGFSTESQEEYIEKMLYDKAKYLKKAINDNGFLRTASQSPLMLHLMCCVYGKDVSKISSRTELYLQIFRLELEIYAEKHGRNDIYRRIQENRITHDRLFVGLGEVAWEYLANQERITEESLSAKFKEQFEFVIGLGILVEVPTLSNMKRMTIYEFSHFTFAEFLSTIYVVDAVRNSKSTLEKEFIKVLEMGFFAGILGEEILRIDEALSWIESSNFNATTMLEIKNGANLNEEAWKSFCSHIKYISSDCSRADQELLLSTSLPELSEVNVSCVKAETKTELLKHTKRLLRNLRPHKLLRIEMPFNILRLSSSQTDDNAFHVINMQGIMTELIDIANYMRSKFVKSIVCVQILATGVLDVLNEKESFSEVTKGVRKAPIGLLPDKLLYTRGHYEHFDHTWKMGNIEIRYHVPSEDEESERFAVPIIVVYPEEYNKITKTPFLHNRALKVEFESSPFKDTSDGFKMPRILGNVDCRTFFERLDRWREEKQLIPNEKSDIASCNSVGAVVETFHFTYPANQKKLLCFIRHNVLGYLKAIRR